MLTRCVSPCGFSDARTLIAIISRDSGDLAVTRALIIGVVERDYEFLLCFLSGVTDEKRRLNMNIVN